ncbi:MAG TPA: aldehyde dehydrogenase family protein [Phycisphaerales bacterium]|nr:aldehyde dehydrogenase family protein [Phycisphaerales bacterium]
MPSTHPSLSHAPSNLIGVEWVPIPGDALRSENPARPAETVWQGSPDESHVDRAVAAARAALPAWSAMGFEGRSRVLRRFQALARERAEAVAALVRDEVGKAMWDARAEAALLAAKVDVTLDPAGAINRVTPYDVPLSATRTGRCDFRPHGVMAVIGPFNFPAHLPNGHIVPALALGNTVVFKPSDKAPAAGQMLAELFDEACRAQGAPAGVVNLVQGGASIARRLTGPADVDGVLFTGSWPVGRAITQANLDRPDRILALEMGGNSPALVMHDADLRLALVECLRSAFVTTGQRCTCTRRIILHEPIAAKFLSAFERAARTIIVGDPRSPGVFMGPIVSRAARDDVLHAQAKMLGADGEAILESRSIENAGGGWFLSPGIVRVDAFTRTHDLAEHAGADEEVFGPLVRVCVARDLDHAIELANATRFGLAASIFTRSESQAQAFLRACLAGCINVNTGTAGASGKLPFGGLGLSGNHRPAGAFSVDYCAHPVASMVESAGDATPPEGLSINDAWPA